MLSEVVKTEDKDGEGICGEEGGGKGLGSRKGRRRRLSAVWEERSVRRSEEREEKGRAAGRI